MEKYRPLRANLLNCIINRKVNALDNKSKLLSLTNELYSMQYITFLRQIQGINRDVEKKMRKLKKADDIGALLALLGDTAELIYNIERLKIDTKKFSILISDIYFIVSEIKIDRMKHRGLVLNRFKYDLVEIEERRGELLFELRKKLTSN